MESTVAQLFSSSVVMVNLRNQKHGDTNKSRICGSQLSRAVVVVDCRGFSR